MKFTNEERKELEQNPNVQYVTPRYIFYTNEFKEKAITEYLMGKSARKIFEDAGFNLQILSKDSDYASKTLGKWRNSSCNNKNNIHYPKKKIKENKSNYQKMQARLEYLEAENEFLKKLRALNNQFR